MKKVLGTIKNIILALLSLFFLLLFIFALGDKDTSSIAFIFLFFLILCVAFIILSIVNGKSRKEKKAKLDEMKKTTDEFISKGYQKVVEYNYTMLLVNEKEKKFTIGNDIYKFSDLISAEIVENSDTITTTYTKNKASLGKALVGGAIFGVAGAIVGGNAGKSTSRAINTQVCDKLEVKLILNSISNSQIFIPLILKRIRKKSKKYKNAYDISQKYLSIFQVIINNK